MYLRRLYLPYRPCHLSALVALLAGQPATNIRRTVIKVAGSHTRGGGTPCRNDGITQIATRLNATIASVYDDLACVGINDGQLAAWILWLAQVAVRKVDGEHAIGDSSTDWLRDDDTVITRTH